MISALITLVIYIIVLGLVVWLLNYVLDNVPLPEPLGRVARVLVIVVAVLIIIVLLLNLVGGVNIDMPKVG